MKEVVITDDWLILKRHKKVDDEWRDVKVRIRNKTKEEIGAYLFRWCRKYGKILVVWDRR